MSTCYVVDFICAIARVGNVKRTPRRFGLASTLASARPASRRPDSGLESLLVDDLVWLPYDEFVAELGEEVKLTPNVSDAVSQVTACAASLPTHELRNASIHASIIVVGRLRGGRLSAAVPPPPPPPPPVQPRARSLALASCRALAGFSA